MDKEYLKPDGRKKTDANFLRFRSEDLKAFTVKFMSKLGVPKKDAMIVGDVLLEADIRGIDSHGLIRLSSYYGSRLEKKYMDPVTKIEVISETDNTILIDGGNGIGQVVSYGAMEKCIKKARKCNVAIASVRHSNHYGIAAYYSMMALEYDMIGVSLTNSQPLMAPTYGKTAILGTNPISIAVPSFKHYPYVLDMSTSVVPIGRIRVYEKKGEKIPLGWAMDDKGCITDDPGKVSGRENGVLLPLGGTDVMRGYKGYGLALLVDILSGALSGAETLINVGSPSKPGEANVGHFFMAIRIDAFRPIIEFKKQLDHMIKVLKNSPKESGKDRIYIAGEKEFIKAEINRKNGIPLLDNVVKELKKSGEKIGVPFEIEPIN